MRLLLLWTVAAASAQTPDAVYINGSVVTMDPAGRVAEAVATGGGRIVRVGAAAEIRKLAGPATRVIDLRGGAMLPGLYAAHDHFPQWGANALYQVDLNSPPIGPCRTVEDWIRRLAEKARATPPGEWVLGRGYDDTLIQEKRHPTRADLDRVSTRHPVWVVHTSGHLGAANGLALHLAGITRDTPQPKGGVLHKDAKTGEPTGLIEESLGLVSRHIPPMSRGQWLKSVARAQEEYFRQGVTTTVIAGMGYDRLEALAAARAAGILQLRVAPMRTGAKDHPAFKTRTVKIWHDGSIQGFTGFLSAPYHRQPAGKQGYRGYAMRGREDLARSVVALHKQGLQVAIHGNGDAAIDDILHAFREARRAAPRQDARHRIEHCQTPRDDQLRAMRELEVTPSFFVGHVYYWGDRHRDIFLGPARAARISPLASALRHGLRFTVHNDTPVTPVNPLHLVWVSVNRKTRDGAVLGPDERIGVREALRAVTIDAAWQNFEEKEKGSIEPGKLADFTIVDRNPLAAPAAELDRVRVVETIVGGASVYRREGE